MRHMVGRIAPALACAVLATSCSDSTGPGSALAAQVAAHQARWTGLHITRYRYDYSETGFFTACGGMVHVYVRDGVVDSAVAIATGQRSQLSTQCWPTIDGLFATADSAAAHGTLSGIRYDAAFSYPTEIDLPGPPDASGSLYASALLPMP